MTTRLKTRVLLAEDERHLSEVISYNLVKKGFDVITAARGDEALEIASTQGFDLIILDVMMPGKDGFEVCSVLRAKRVLTPILMLTARHETENRIKGIQLGADDYLGKPFDLAELFVRIEALLRRRQWDEQLGATTEDDIFKLGEIEFDSNLLQLTGHGKKVALTAIEAKLLRLFLTERGRTVSRAQILKRVWGLHEETQTRTLDNFIMRLRHHFAEVGGTPEWIESVRGVGYRLSV